MHELHLGLFTFKNDDVLLLASSRPGISTLADRFEAMLQRGQSEMPIHEQARVSQKHPAKLFAVNEQRRSAQQGEFFWPINQMVIEALRSLGAESNERYFTLSHPHDIFQVTSSPYYSAQWWETYA